MVTSIEFYNTHTSKNYLPDMKEMVDQGSEISLISGHIYKAVKNDQIIGYFDQQSAIGYAGPVDVIVFVDKDGLVKNVKVVRQIETPSFFNRVIAKGFVKQFIDKKANSPFELGQDLDAITNATYTSRAIALAVNKASHNIAVTQLKMEVPKTVGFNMPLQDYLVLALLLGVFIVQKLKWSKLRYLTLLAGFLLIGFWQKSLLSLGDFSSVLAGNISWFNPPFWIILLIGVLFLILITGRNLYCFWLCPYGALSELLAVSGKFGRLNYKPCEESVKRFSSLRLLLTWGALVFAFLMNNPSISSYEIFAPLFAWEGTSAQWLLLPIMLFACVFIFRFWCHFFCPVGGILDYLVKCRRSWMKWLEDISKKNKLDQTEIIK
jgi:uncharacterized protein with FMN-binding domain